MRSDYSEFRSGLDVSHAAIRRTNGVGDAEDQSIAAYHAACEHLSDGVSKRDLTVAIAALAAEVWGLRNSRDQDALLAIHQIGKHVDEYRRRHETGSATTK